MKRFAIALTGVLFLCSSEAGAQAGIRILIPLPPVPKLVVVMPGIQVVEGFQEEVFFNSGWYWCRRPNGWYRSRSPRAHFNWVEERHVPGGLMRIPSGHYRNWHRTDPRHDGHRESVRERREVGRDHREPVREHRDPGRDHKAPVREQREIKRDQSIPDRRKNDNEHGRHEKK